MHSAVEVGPNTMRFAINTSILPCLLAIGWLQVSAAQDTPSHAQVISQEKQPAPQLPLPTPDQGAPAAPVRPSGPPPSPGCYFLNARTFTIPFSVDAAGSQPREVELFTSRGPVSPWKRVDGKPATTKQKEFQFEGNEDGEFWFATRTIDAKGRAHPSGPIRPQLKVFVDTRKPEVAVQADADASGRVDATVSADDSTPLKIQVRYATDTDRTWHAVDVPEEPGDGKLRFTPRDAWQQLSLQVIVTDAAKNRSVFSKLINRPRLAERNTTRLAADTSDETGVDAKSAQYRVDADPATARTVADQLNRGVVAPQPITPSYVQDYSARSSLGGFRGGALPPGSTNPQRTVARPSRPSARPSGLNQLFQPPAPRGQNTPNAANTGVTALPMPASPADISNRSGPNMTFAGPAAFQGVPPNQGLPQNQGLPPNQGLPRRTLTQESVPAPAGEPDVDGLNSPQQSGSQQSVPPPETKPVPTGGATGGAKSRPKTVAEALRPLTPARPAPIGGVESIPAPTGEADPEIKRRAVRKAVTIEAAGRAPIRFSDSLRFSLDFEVEAIGSAGVEAIELYGSVDGGKNWKFWGKDPDRISPFDIETKEQGAFGFRIVVLGKNGLASPRPLPGETPDIIVIVDQAKPAVRISGAQYGEGDRVGSLVIQYECSDANLKQRPIALSFSDSMNGPWTTIAAGLRNEGSYVWPADPGLPRKMYLRIDATDRSGNVGSYLLDRPIDVQGLAPRARIRGFQSLTGNEPESAGQQTAVRPRGRLK